MSEAAIAEKKKLVADLKEKVDGAKAIVVVDYLGLNVAEATELRKQLREADVEFKVIKNSMISRAVKDAGIDGMDDLFNGPTAVAFSKEDVIAAEKIIANFAKTAEHLTMKGGVIEGKVVSVEELETLAKLPNREGLLSMLLSTLQAPVRNVALAVKAVGEKKGEAAA